MNRDSENNNRSRKNHYADFDEHGNARTGNRNSLSRYNPDDRNDTDSGLYNPEGSHRNRDRDRHEQRNQHDRNRMTSDARAYGDFSGGTRYGEGGSTYGGGSAYGPSNYGMSGNERPRNQGGDRNYYDHDSHSRQNYGRSGGNNYSGRMNDDRDAHYRGVGYDDRFGVQGADQRRNNTGYDRGFDDYGNTGYGATRYNNRDEDQERSAYSNRGYRNEQRGNYGGSGEGRRGDERGRDRNRYDREG